MGTPPGIEPWTAAAVLGPLVAALVALDGRASLVRAGLALGSLASAAGAAGLWAHVVGHGPARQSLGGWGQPLGIELVVDGSSVAFVAVTALVGAAISLYSSAYFGDLSHLSLRESPAGRGARFFAPLWLLVWSALNGIFLSGDVFNLYVGLEILGLAAAAIVTLAVTSQATVAGMRYLVVSLVGSLLYLLGVVLLYIEHGTLSLAGLAAGAPGGALSVAALAVMSAGLAAKSALFPFHAWLPPAHAGAPAPGSALLSALVVKGSFFVLLRLWSGVLGGGAPGGLLVLGLLGGAAILWGSGLALRQRSLKRLIAYSTVAQLGYLFVMFPLLVPASGERNQDAWVGGLLLALSHALAKAAMFLAAGNMTYAVARDSLRAISGIAHRLPMSFLAFGIGGLGLAGLPPSAGFLGKWLLLRAALEEGRWGWAALIAAGGLLTAAYVLVVLRYALQVRATPAGFRPVPRRMEWSALILALAALVLGVRAAEVVDLLLAGDSGGWE